MLRITLDYAHVTYTFEDKPTRVRACSCKRGACIAPSGWRNDITCLCRLARRGAVELGACGHVHTNHPVWTFNNKCIRCHKPRVGCMFHA